MNRKLQGNFKNSEINTDLLIIGSGLAGLYAALYASKFAKVTLITKSTLIESNSYWAQGGIAAAVDPEDSPVFHKEDTINAGRGLCNTEAVNVLVKEGKERILDLINLGMEFDSDEHGLMLGLEGGHSKRRVLHAGGSSTGKKMVEFLISAVEKSSEIDVLELATVTDLISDNKTCFGAWAYKQDSDEYLMIKSKSTILATGGASALYRRTTNPEGATGEGIYLSYKAGAEIMDMEFVQYHPTSFYSDDGESFLITETVRGEGAHLLDHRGKRFMKKYHKLAELAPRDIVSNSIYSEIKESGKNFVYLTLSHLDRSFIIKRFSNIYGQCLNHGFDLTSDLIPVAPAAHYTVGGVRTGLSGETNLKGLFACGEVTCTGVHGANRLASNSLLECIVFSNRAVDGAKENLEGEFVFEDPNDVPTLLSDTNPDDKEQFKELKELILANNHNFLGIVRNNNDLEVYISELNELSVLKDSLSGWFKFKLDSMIKVSSLIATSALLRKESRGAHIREDFPDESEQFKFHYVVKIGSEPYKVEV